MKLAPKPSSRMRESMASTVRCVPSRCSGPSSTSSRSTRQFLLAQDAQTAAADLRGADEKLERAGRAQALEVDQTSEQVAQRIEVERVELRRREEAGPAGDQFAGRRQLVGIAVALADHGRGQLRPTAAQKSASAWRAPSRPPCCHPWASTTAFIAPALLPADAADAVDADAAVFEQRVEHAPGEGAVRAGGRRRPAHQRPSAAGTGQARIADGRGAASIETV